MKDCLRKMRFGFKQARRMVQDRNKWKGFVRENMGRSTGDEPPT